MVLFHLVCQTEPKGTNVSLQAPEGGVEFSRQCRMRGAGRGSVLLAVLMGHTPSCQSGRLPVFLPVCIT